MESILQQIGWRGLARCWLTVRGRRAGLRRYAVRADAAERGRSDAADRESGARRLCDRPRLGRRPHGHHRGARSMARAVLASISTGGWCSLPTAARRRAGRCGPRGVLRARSLRNRSERGERGHDLSAARSQPDGAAEAARDAETRHAHRVARLRHGRMEARPATGDGRARQAGRPRQEEQSVFTGSCRPTPAGKWRWEMPVDGKPAVLRHWTSSQNFQAITGSVAGRRHRLGSSKTHGCSGEDISFTVNDPRAKTRYDFSGTDRRSRHYRCSARGRRERAQRQLEWDAARTEPGDPAHALLKKPTLQELQQMQ